MELIISLLLGVWIALGGWISYKNIKKEYDSTMEGDNK